MNMKRIRMFFGMVCASACVASSVVAGEVVDLYTAVTEAGLSLSASTVRGSTGNAKLLFNGVTYATLINDKDPGERFLFNRPTADTIPSTTVTIPSEFAADSRIVLRRVELYPVTYWSNADVRMPDEYKIIGITDAGFEYELAHPPRAYYPNLGTNGREGEHYDVQIADTLVSNLGFRAFKFVFLHSRGLDNANQPYPYCLMEIGLKVEILPPDPVLVDLYAVQNFSTMIRNGGYPIRYGTSYDYTWGLNAWAQAANAFDGYTFHEDISTYGDNFRWLGYMNREGGTYAALRMPSDFRPGDFFFPVGCRLWTLSYNANEIVRAPTEWKLFGVADPYDDVNVWKKNDETGVWTEIGYKSGLSYSGVIFNTRGANTLGLWTLPAQTAGYRAFRFRPLKSSVTATSGIDVGFSEFEILGLPVNEKGSLRIRADKSGCTFGDGYLSDGALVKTATTVTAPEYVQSGAKGFLVKGYRVETFDYENHAWVIGESVASRTYDYVPDENVSARLVWEVEETGFRIGTSLLDCGKEEPVTYNPAVSESGPFFSPGTELTLTAHPNSDELESANGATNLFRSVFVRWEGDTNDLEDVTSPTLTFTVDRPRDLHPVFRRDWLVYKYDKANEGGSGVEWRLTDGNFDLRCLFSGGLENGQLGFSSGNWLVAGHGDLDLSTKMVNAETGQEITITSIGWSQLGSDSARRADFTRVVLPRTLVNLACSAFRDQTNLVEVVIDCPDLKTMGGTVFTRDSSLRSVVFKAPSLEAITGRYIFFKAPMDLTDANEWELDSLKSLTTVENGGDSRFNIAECGDGHGFQGTLSLPALETVSDWDFQYHQHMTNLVLGTTSGSLRSVGQYAFNQCKALQAMTIGCTEDLTVNASAFINCPKLKDITFVKYIPSREALDGILASATSSSRAKVYVSPARKLNEGFVDIDRELDPNPPEGAEKVYVRESDGERLAWGFYRKSPLDPKGTYLILR